MTWIACTNFVLRKPTACSCRWIVSELTNFVKMSAGFDNVPTFVTCNVPLATNSCTNNCRNSICFVFRVIPLLEVSILPMKNQCTLRYSFCNFWSIPRSLISRWKLQSSSCWLRTIPLHSLIGLLSFESLTKMSKLHLQRKSCLRSFFVGCHDIQPNRYRYSFRQRTIRVRLLGLEILFSVEFWVPDRMSFGSIEQDVVAQSCLH